MYKSMMTVVLSLTLAGSVLAQDMRQLVPMTPQAQEALRQEMVGNLAALHEIMSLLAQNKTKEAGLVAETSLGRSAMGKSSSLPPEARPGMQMPPAMHSVGKSGHWAASEFAQAASSGDRDKALALLPNLTESCMACHAAYRTR